MLMNDIKSVKWEEGSLYILDQTKLPLEIVYEKEESAEQAWKAIKELKVRGAPAIGIAGAYSLLVSIKDKMSLSSSDFISLIKEKAAYLDSSRPTAVNLGWALRKMVEKAQANKDKSAKEIYDLLEKEAIEIHNEDIEICRKIGEHGFTLFKKNMGIITHCNAGKLAVSDYGTALSPIYLAHEKGLSPRVYADETRPLLQGARLTSFELKNAGVDVTLICDNMAAYVMSKGLIDIAIVGCDRVARNGDTANKIGTMGLAILAKHFDIPFYIACPSSTLDFNTASGDDIIIEEREANEIIHFGEKRTAPSDVKVKNPAFDVTPNELIEGFITEKGIIKKPFDENLKKAFGY